jgi:hypothetical protein
MVALEKKFGKRCSKANLKSMMIKHLLFPNHSEYEMHQTNVYLYALYYRFCFEHDLVSVGSFIVFGTEFNENVV